MVSVENCEVSEGVIPLPHLFVVPISSVYADTKITNTGVWCNGSTAVSKIASQSSSLCTPARVNSSVVRRTFGWSCELYSRWEYAIWLFFKYLGVYQLVDFLIWDQEAAGSSPVTQTNYFIINYL